MSTNTQLKRLTSFLLFLSFTFHAFAEGKKVALVWGNATYEGQWQSLPVVNNDANTINGIFKSLGYETRLLHDGNLDEMKRSLRDFSALAKNADIAVFYYSGHATRVENAYYLIPAKSRLNSDVLSSELFPARDIMSVLNKSRLRLLFFDSCRDDATVEGLSKGNPNVRESTGVGPLSDGSINLPSGSMICYAADRGNKAYTGTGNLSVFTKVLSEHLTDGDEFRTVWATIIDEVYLIQSQRPVNDGFYQHDLYLNPSGKRHSVPAISPTSINNTQTSPSQKSITISPNAPNATIDFYGTKYVAGKPLLFEEGKTYTYTITAKGYKTYTGKLTVTNNIAENINITMQKDEVATIRITSNAVASVNFDGADVGRTPLILNTTSGTHSVVLSANNYESYNAKIDINAGSNIKHITLTPKTPWFWDFDDVDAPLNNISYTFSPKYQIGFEYLHRFRDSRFLLGGYIGSSLRLFKAMEEMLSAETYAESYAEASASISGGNETISEDINDNSGVEVPLVENTYDANLLILPTLGYQPCNGLLVEAGVGAAAHWDGCKYSTNKETRWSKSNWSPAMRLGFKTFIPINSDKEFFISIGGGYTYLLSNKKYSSWDVSIGLAWSL